MDKNIVLTGFWPPTNEMLRPFFYSPSVHTTHNNWEGKNWKGLGYNIYSYFPEFPDSSMPKGVGRFRVDYESVKKDLQWAIKEHHPVSLISFGKGKAAPWELEVHAPDYWNTGLQKGKSTLPLQQIKNKIIDSGSFPPHFVDIDENGDTGDYVCGYTALLLSHFPELKTAGFIHVNTELELAQKALALSLLALIEFLEIRT